MMSYHYKRKVANINSKLYTWNERAYLLPEILSWPPAGEPNMSSSS